MWIVVENVEKYDIVRENPDFHGQKIPKIFFKIISSRAVHAPGLGKTENCLNVWIFSIACREYHRIRCPGISRSRDSDIKNMSRHSQRPPELGATACQSRGFS